MQPLKQIMVTPKERIGGFTVGKAYEVLAIGMDINYQPLFTVPDDSMQVKNVSAERFLYRPGGYIDPVAPPEQEEVDYEVVEDNEEDMAEESKSFDMEIDDPEDEEKDAIEELKEQKQTNKTNPRSTKGKKSSTSGAKKSPGRPKKK